MRKVPELTSDDEAERFLDQDLSDLDFSQFERVDFHVGDATEVVAIRIPAGLAHAVQTQADSEGVPYRRFILRAIEHALAEARSRRPTPL